MALNSRKSGFLSFRNILIIELILIFSIFISFLITMIAKDTKPAETSLSFDYKNLKQNYRVLRGFLDLHVETDPDQNEDREIKHKFIIDTLKLRTAAQFQGKKKYGIIEDVILNLDADHPFIIRKKSKLYLKYLYSQKKYNEFIRQCDTYPDFLDKLQLKLFLINSYIKTGNDKKAFEMFKDLFGRNELKPFLDNLPRRKVTAFLKKLDEDYWFEKLKFLAETNRYSEFLRERKYIKNPPLINLFLGEFSYKRKRYDQCRNYLKKVTDEKLAGYKIRIILKINLREDNFDRFDLELEEVKRSGDFPVYLEVLFDAATILLIKDEPELALDLFSRYIKTVENVYLVDFCIFNVLSFPIKDSRYWKGLWLAAWISYKKNDKAAAASFFEQGTDSHILSYKIASTYWLQRLGKSAPTPLHKYPFSYYYAKTARENSGQLKSLEPFIDLLNRKQGPRLHEVVTRIKLLVRYNLMDEAFEYIRWALTEQGLLNGTDKSIIKLAESILHLKRGNYAMAFIRYRDNFACYRCMRLPRFLSQISLPVKYTSLVRRYSQAHNLDSRLIYSLIREESFFQPGALSYANARGLMQLLPKTARQVASPLGINVSRGDLYRPSVNIRLGIEYLKFLLDKYEGKVHLALAAYNAGDHRVDEWLKRFGSAADDEFIEMIPFTATRAYVKNILRNYYYYKFYYDKNKKEI